MASFYVKDVNGNLVPAQFLSDNGQFIVDPNTQKAQGAQLYDASGNLLSEANPNGYLIVPENYSVGQAKDFGSQVADQMLNPDGNGTVDGLGSMVGAFWTGGSQDLQRTYTDINGNLVSNGPAVPSFQDAASWNLGAVTAAAGIPMSWADIGGGALNWAKANIF